MIVAAFACTLPIAPLMLDVVSARNTMSGSGGIGGVSTVLATVVLPPGSSVAVTLVGDTPGAASAAPTVSWTMSSAAPSEASMPRTRW